MGYWVAAVWVVAAAGGAAAVGHWFGKGEKIDRGLVFFYWKLSYRRRFIRTLWLLPLLPPVIVLVQAVFQDWLFTAVISVELLGIWAAQAVVNYRKWKKRKANCRNELLTERKNDYRVDGNRAAAPDQLQKRNTDGHSKYGISSCGTGSIHDTGRGSNFLFF